MPYKDQEKRKRVHRESEARRRAKKLAEDLEYQISHGDLNARLLPVQDEFMSWEQYKEIWGEHAAFDDYLTEKRRVQAEQALQNRLHKESTDIAPLINDMPFGKDPKRCRRFREHYIERTPERGFAHQEHICEEKCSACIAWEAKKKRDAKGSLEGFQIKW